MSVLKYCHRDLKSACVTAAMYRNLGIDCKVSEKDGSHWFVYSSKTQRHSGVVWRKNQRMPNHEWFSSIWLPTFKRLSKSGKGVVRTIAGEL